MGETSLNVALIKYTSEPEEVVALAAKLCYSPLDISELKEGLVPGELENFINKILSVGHLSTIEHVSFTFGIEGVSRSLLAQITRHRIASFSVKSQRYVSETANDEETFNYIIPPRIKELGENYVNEYIEQMDQMQLWYNRWYEVLGGKKSEAGEDARFILPNATETKMILTMNARELYHFFKLRCCNRAQWEIRELSWQMLKLVKEVAPNIFAQAGPGCVITKCPEGKMTCGNKKQVLSRYQSLKWRIIL